MVRLSLQGWFEPGWSALLQGEMIRVLKEIASDDVDGFPLPHGCYLQRAKLPSN